LGCILSIAGLIGGVQAQTPKPTQAILLEIEGTVETSAPGALAWKTAQMNQVLSAGVRVQTRQHSRAVIRLTDLSLLRLGEETLVEIPAPSGNPVLKFLKGVLYYFHRDKPGVMPVKTPTAYAVVIGTEFQASVAADRATELFLIDGRVDLSNEIGQLSLKTGEGAKVSAGAAPARTAVLNPSASIQWALYYPGVLDLDELSLTPGEAQLLGASTAAYRSGDLLNAVASYPAGRQPLSDAEKIFRAASLLAVGSVEEANSLLGNVNSQPTLKEALRAVISTVQGQTHSRNVAMKSSTWFLADSIYLQGQSMLSPALSSAYQAVQINTNFGFGWARVAELEFSFGRIEKARQALGRALALSSKNAEAITLRGFLNAARGDWQDAIADFDAALALDGALGNAWLGRGLCRIRLGQRETGRLDLQTAATVEPQRAILRSYLGKAFANAGDWIRGGNELRLARELDLKDPTAWLYSGILDQQQNRINDAVRDLEMAAALNDNRSIYRSRLLLEQDRAVSMANLALAYQDAGMSEWAMQSASRSVASDPANYSAHLFLGNSFQQLRDPSTVNQRFETPAINEFLLSSLLAPPSGGLLAQSVSQQEYSKLFESDGFGVSSSTEYLSNGDWLEAASQYGTFKNFGYAISALYRSQVGWRPNNDLRQREVSLQLKHQVTEKDSFYFRSIWGDAAGGDLLQRYDPATANTGLRVKETQEPLLLAGYHREWRPGMHTLILGGWFKDDQRVFDPQSGVLVLGQDDSGTTTDVLPVAFEQQYRNQANLFTAEAQQIWQTEEHTLIAGARAQGGQFEVDNLHTNAAFPFPFLFPNTNVAVRPSMERYSLYAYHQWRPVRPLLFVAGLSYDWLRYPTDFRYAPLSSGESHKNQLSPKGGLVWTPGDRTAVRAAYSRSLGGVSFDQSFRLEPTQVAGFNQAFRSLIPESVAGANSAADFETWGVSWQERLATNTWLTLSGEWLRSNLRRQIGVYDFASFAVSPDSTREELKYDERSLQIVLNQMIGREWSLGALYRLSEAELNIVFPDVPATAATAGGFRQSSSPESLLHHVNLFAHYNHPCGFFSQAQALWYRQSNHGYEPARPGDDFWQFNVFAGCRFLQRRGELTAGVLNLTGQNYRLNPLNLTPELPRERTFLLALRMNF
jgi:tetratricopeptide (TPR) repeat protein